MLLLKCKRPNRARRIPARPGWDHRRVERHPEPGYHGNPGKQRFATYRIRFMKEILVYHVAVSAPLPEPSTLNPYGPSHRSEAIGVNDLHDQVVANPQPAPTRFHRPTRAEFARSFARSGPLPTCVRETRAARFAEIHNIESRLGFDVAQYPRQLRKALAAYDFGDLWCAYDPALIGRIKHYAFHHERRAYLAKFQPRSASCLHDDGVV
jgi:hypothetical protein